MGKRKRVSDEGSRRFHFIANAWDWLTPYVHGCTGVSGPSSCQQPPQARSQISSSSPKSPKKPRKEPQGSDVTSPEKRGAIFKKSCPKNILDRVARVMSQR